MFSQRFVALLLLMLYGVPAAVGPYWHRHGQDCQHAAGCLHVVVSQSDIHQRDICPAHAAHAERACCAALSDAPHSVQPAKAFRSFQATRAEAMAMSSGAGQGEGGCAICQFYSSFSLPLVGTLWTLPIALPEATANPADLCANALPYFCQARGPPA